MNYFLFIIFLIVIHLIFTGVLMIPLGFANRIGKKLSNYALYTYKGSKIIKWILFALGYILSILLIISILSLMVGFAAVDFSMEATHLWLYYITGGVYICFLLSSVITDSIARIIIISKTLALYIAFIVFATKYFNFSKSVFDGIINVYIMFVFILLIILVVSTASSVFKKHSDLKWPVWVRWIVAWPLSIGVVILLSFLVYILIISNTSWGSLQYFYYMVSSGILSYIIMLTILFWILPKYKFVFTLITSVIICILNIIDFVLLT